MGSRSKAKDRLHQTYPLTASEALLENERVVEIMDELLGGDCCGALMPPIDRGPGACAVGLAPLVA